MLKRPEGAQPELLLHFEFARNNGYYLEIKEGYWRAEAWKEEGLRRIVAPENKRMDAMIATLSHYYSEKI